MPLASILAVLLGASASSPAGAPSGAPPAAPKKLMEFDGCLERPICVEGSCPPILLDVEVRATRWERGCYTIRGRADGVPSTCHFDIPPPFGLGQPPLCDGPGVFWGWKANSRTGCEPDVPEGVVLYLQSAPKVLEVEVLRDGDTIAEEELRPVYPEPPDFSGARVGRASLTVEPGEGRPAGPCPEVACERTVAIDVVSFAFGRGRYVVEGTTDGTPFRCEGVFPAGPDVHPRCDRRDVRLSLAATGSGRPDLQLELFDGTPETVEVAVRNDGTVIGRETLRPRYNAAERNGARCGEPCPFAHGRIRLDARATRPRAVSRTRRPGAPATELPGPDTTGRHGVEAR